MWRGLPGVAAAVVVAAGLGAVTRDEDTAPARTAGDEAGRGEATRDEDAAPARAAWRACEARPRALGAQPSRGATTARVPGRPFDVVADRGGRWAFASLPSTAGRPRLAVLRRSGGRLRLARVVALDPDLQPYGLAVAGRRLLVAAGAALVSVELAELRDGGRVRVRRLARGAGLIGVAATADGRAVFATDESRAELVAVRAGRDARLPAEAPDRAGRVARPPAEAPDRAGRVARVPLAKAPVGVALSADERHVFVTSEFDADWRDVGVLSVVDAQRALDGGAGGAVIATAPAGCHPVRVLYDPARHLVWVSARESHAVLAFAVAASGRLTRLATVPVGPSPVDLALVDGGRSLVVADSRRFATRRGSLSVVDVRAALAGRPGETARLQTGRFPRALARSRGGAELLVANYGSRTVETIPAAALP
jgi:hypothetical protein